MKSVPAPSEWVGWSNHRLLESIGNNPPAKVEDQYSAILDGNAMAA